MESFFNNLKYRFRQKDILIQLIVINFVIFAILASIALFCKLFKIETLGIIDYVGVSSDVSLLVRFWTPFTYMFVHQEFLHILFNMLMLYWFGQMFLAWFNPKMLGSLYILGGLAGALLYIIAFNTIPYYVDKGHVPMIGASASVMAIIFAVAFYRPNAPVRLFLLGEIKILYIAIFLLMVNYFALGSESNAGGYVAHIGGAILGYAFAALYLRGKDITRWLTKTMDWVAGLSLPKKKTKMKVKFKQREEDYQYNQRKHNAQDEIDQILDKIKASGYTSLTKDEKQKLFDASRK